MGARDLSLLPFLGGHLASVPAGEERVIHQLTPRELEIIHQMAMGMPNQQIADALVIAERTVRTHVSAILSKLGAGNRTDAVRIASQENLLDAEIVKVYFGRRSSRPYRNGETDPPTIEGYFWMEIPEPREQALVQLASSAWGEWRMARHGREWEPYLPHRVLLHKARWWGPVVPPFGGDEEAGPTVVQMRRGRLTDHDVVEIRRLGALGHTQVAIARAFNVSVSTVGHIVNHRTYRRVK